MSALRTEDVDVHAIQAVERGWEVQIYQSAQVLRLTAEQSSLSELIKAAAAEGASVKLSWDEDSGAIQAAE